MKTASILLFSYLFFISPGFAQQELFKYLAQDVEDGSLDSMSPIDAAFIISGVTHVDSLDDALNWYHEIIADIQNKRIVDVFDKPASAEKLFLYLHTTWLITYKKEATTLLDIKRRKEFNCVSATILYNLICDELGLSTMAFETPSHVYTIFSDFGHDIMVENTTSMGFNIIKNLKNYSKYMSQYYPEKEIYQIGLDRLYAYENSRGRQISNVELLGLICYNQAYFAFHKKAYPEAYDYVLLAQKFNHDSRSNQNFEQKLYYTWGDHLFKNKDFYQSFEIFADAYFRYPTNRDFKQNCIAAFINALQSTWTAKDWNTTQQIIQEIEELDILSNNERSHLQDVLVNWIYYFYQQKQKQEGLAAIDLLKALNLNRDRLLQLDGMIRSLR